MMSYSQLDNEVVSPGAVLQQIEARAFISQLPTELLVYTLHSVLPYVDFMSDGAVSTSSFYMRTLYTIRRVAKQWQEIIDGTPSFWTVIPSVVPAQVSNTTILRSGALPLVVICEVAWSSEHQPPKEFLRAIAHTRSRWSAIVLELFDHTCMQEFLATPAPLLQAFVIRGSWDYALNSEPLELLGGHTSNLRYVNIFEVSIRWKMGMFTELKALILTNVLHNGLTTSYILDFLRASPCLEYLHIKGFGIAPLRPPSSPTITLPYLKSIDLRSDSSIVTDSILRHIQAPSCSKLIVSVDTQGGFDSIRFINETLNPFHRILQELHVRNGASDLSISPYEFTWQSFLTPNPEYGFSVSIKGPLDSLAIRWVEQTLQKESGLRLNFGLGHTLRQAVFEALAPMQCVTRASIMGQGWKPVRRIFYFLSSPLSPSSSLPSLPCLRELLISSMEWSVQDLLDMVQFRSSALPYVTMDRPNLTIKVWRGEFKRDGSPNSMFDLSMLCKIRATEGVESLRLAGRQRADGMLAITWNEEASEPTWG